MCFKDGNGRRGYQTQLLSPLGEVHITVVHLVGSMWARIKEIVMKNNKVLLR